jgi:NAD-specific glutamate dehydrogenase
LKFEKIHATIVPRRNLYAGIRDAAHQAHMVTHSCHHKLMDRMKYAHFPQWASGSTYIHVEHVPNSRNFKLKKQVELTTALTKELDSTTEEVEFWQEKYEEAMKIVRKLKPRCTQDVETLSKEETEEFTPASPPRKMVTRAPPVYVIPNNDDD